MALFRATDADKAARQQAEAASEAAATAELDGRRLAAKRERDAERQQEWASALGAGAVLPAIDRIFADSTAEAYTNLARYLAEVGIDPGDVYGFHLEVLENHTVILRSVAVLYRDRPEYATRRDAFWVAHPDLAPHHRVEGDGSPASLLE